MRVLIVEDDFTARKLLQAYLKEYFECDVAVNGKEAVEAYRAALDAGLSYELICMDVSMPEMNGQDALKEIRTIEAEHKIDLGDGARVIMTTAFNDKDNIMQAFRLGCESYLVKPVCKSKLFNEIEKLGLLQITK